MTYGIIWGLPIALYLFLAGLGGGAYLTSTFMHHVYPDAAKTRRLGHYIAFLTVLVGLALLMIDAQGGLFHPWRFALLLHNFGSVMVWGVVFLAVFLIISFIVCVIDLTKHQVPEWLDVIGAIFGFCVTAYTGVLLGVVHAMPLWNNPVLPLLFIVSAISTGAASVMLAGLIGARGEVTEVPTFKKVHFWFPVAEAVLVLAMLFIVNSNGNVGHASVMQLVAGAYAPEFWILFVILGLVIPILIEGTELFSKKHPAWVGSPTIGMASEVCVLIGGLFLRILIIYAAIPIAASIILM